MMKKYKPVVLIILDGWGLRETWAGNAVVQANTPNLDRWRKENERSILDASGEAVGLTAGQMGNSEVGHLNIGAGRIVYQDISRIDKAIRNGAFFENPILKNALEETKSKGRNLHLFGLLGPGGVHSHARHLYALLKMAADHEIVPIIHVITDGRDTPPNSGITFLEELQNVMTEYPAIIRTVIGRYYAMDRDKRWDRTRMAYDAYVNGQGIQSSDPKQAVLESYSQELSDEFIKPVVITQASDDEYNVKAEDMLLFYNFRADRMRQIVKSFAIPAFDDFQTNKDIRNLKILTFTEYEKGLPVEIVFPKESVKMSLAETLSTQGLKQFHAAETEKYSHVTFFLNGGREEPFQNEERLLVPSPKVATYDLQPEMSAFPLTEALMKRLKMGIDDFIVINYANMDMVGHTGILQAGIKAVETVDTCASSVVNAVIQMGGVAVITADHGNAEQMADKIRGEAHTYHTTNPVQLFILAREYFQLRPRGRLEDIAPTLLSLLELEQPDQMTGKNLILASKLL